MEEIERDKRLRSSILKTGIGYFLIQCLIFGLFALIGKFETTFDLEFLATTAAFHVLIIVFLLLVRADFVREATGERLDRINKANKITLVRLSTLPTLLFLVIAAKAHKIRLPLLLLVVFIFVTDFLDGYISRKNNEVTRIGRILDSTSDYLLLVVLSIVFQYYNLIPVWLLILVLARLSIQFIFMAILTIVKHKVEPKTTKLGKVTIASIMVFYTIDLIGVMAGGLPSVVGLVLEIIVSAIVVVSIVDKVLSFVGALQEKVENDPDGQGAAGVYSSGRDINGND
jgi:phosphatidylglycerophosphate synthase